MTNAKSESRRCGWTAAPAATCPSSISTRCCSTSSRRPTIVYGPLVDAQEFPEGVDVTLVEGAVSNQDDLKLIQKIRQRTKLLVALGDCAVTSNVPSMRNCIPVKKLLDRGYIEGADVRRCRSPPTACPACCGRRCPCSDVVNVDAAHPRLPAVGGGHRLVGARACSQAINLSWPAR